MPFHIITLKKQKCQDVKMSRLQTAPRNQGRLANLRKRQDFAPCANFVASIMPCRNNSEKISPKFLESGQNRRTFASSIRQNKFWETQTRELIK